MQLHPPFFPKMFINRKFPNKSVLYLCRFDQMMFKKCFKGIRSTTMFNNFSVDDFIDIHPRNFQNLIRGCYSNKLPFVCSSHNKF